MKRLRYILSTLMVCSLAICMAACQFDRNLIKENAGKDLHIIRYDRMVDDYVNTGNVALWQRMNTEFPRETRALIEDVLHLGRADNEDIDDSLIAYYKDPILVQLRMDISRKFEDLSAYEKALSCAFKRLEAEDKNFVTPKIYAQNSAFNQSIVVGDSLIGISLDKYMGADYPAYKKYFYENQRATMEPSRIVQDCLYFYLNQQFPPTRLRIRHTLGQWLIHQGKIAWVVAQLTNKSAIDIAACQPATKAWYKLNERRVWNTLRNEKIWNSYDSLLLHSILYSSDAHLYFVDPHSRGVGLWIGMRIVEGYMKHHPEMSFDALLRYNNYDLIKKESNY